MPPSPPTPVPLRVAGLTKSYDGTTVVDDVHLDLEPGRIHALLGENGAGKSTLIKMLAGLIGADAGHLAIGREIQPPRSVGQAQQLGIVALPQELSLVPTMNATDNIALGQRVASAALHELSSPDRTFSNILSLLNPGGLLAVVEMGAPPRFLRDEVGDGPEARIHEVLGKARAGGNDHPDWSLNLERAGFMPVEKEEFSIDMAIETGGIGGRYAQTYLRRIQPHVAPGLSPTDRAMLDALVADSGTSSLRHRDDLHFRASRTAWAARRP